MVKPGIATSNPITAREAPLSPAIPPVPLLPMATTRWRAFGLPLLLLAVSLITMTAIGARFMQNFHDGLPAVANEGDLWPWPWLLAQPHRFLLGWPFSLSLLSILLTHEFGHYIACRVHGIRATLPMVLPAPTLSGTAGAIIQLRSRIPNRRALMDVGVYGPLAGYIASLVVSAAGLLLSTTAPADQAPGPLIGFGEPLTLKLLHAVLHPLHPATPSFELATRHPVLIAGWIGLFITALNLIPGGQLDGGHILYALWPATYRKLRYAVPLTLIACGIFFWLGWILWGLLLLIPVMRHPHVHGAPGLDRKRMVLGAIALAIFALTFSAAPFTGSSVIHYFR
jgi:membrane-associated protease RseP (regulator of RpoE activity)